MKTLARNLSILAALAFALPATAQFQPGVQAAKSGPSVLAVPGVQTPGISAVPSLPSGLAPSNLSLGGGVAVDHPSLSRRAAAAVPPALSLKAPRIAAARPASEGPVNAAEAFAGIERAGNLPVDVPRIVAHFNAIQKSFSWGDPADWLMPSGKGTAKFQGLSQASVKPPIKEKASSGAGVSGWASSPKKSRLVSWLRNGMLGMLMWANVLSANPTTLTSQIDTDPARIPTPVVQLAEARVARADHAAFVQARSMQEVIAKYQKENHLYVIGDVGLGQAELKDLSQFLSDKHWVVVLVEDSSNESYRDIDGRTRYGDDAVEYAVGQGLFKKSDFQSFVYEATGQADGAIFTIILNQHVLLLRTSKAQDTHGLSGERNFRGNLDQWAVSNLRSGGDVAGAVRDTVSNVDSMLERAVQADIESAQSDISRAKEAVSAFEAEAAAFAKAFPQASAGRSDLNALKSSIAKAEAAMAKKDFGAASEAARAAEGKASSALSAMRSFKSSYEGASQAVAQAKAEAAELGKAASDFRAAYPKVTGELSRPDVKAVQEKIDQAERLLAKEPQKAAAAVESIRSGIREALSAIAEYPSGAQMIKAAEARLQELQGMKRSWAAPQELAAAKTALGEAREQWETGASTWRAQLQSAKIRLADAASAIAEADAAAATKLFLLWLSGISAMIGTFAGGFLLNRRVRPVREKARKLYTSWDTALDVKLEAAISHLDQMITDYATASNTGKTAALAEQARQDVGYVHLVWELAKKIHGDARKLIYPSNPLLKAWNFFFPGRLAQGLKLLQDKPVSFDPENQKLLEEVFGKKHDWKTDLYGKLEDYQPFEKSFAGLMDEFNSRAARAGENLELIEKCLLDSGPSLEKAAEMASKAEAGKPGLEAAAAEDGLFLAPSVFSSMLPAARSAMEKAMEMVKSDPVGGMQGEGGEAVRLSEEASGLVGTLAEGRKTSIAAAYKDAAALKAAGLGTSWIDAALRALSGTAESIAASAVLEPVSEKIKGLADGLSALAAKTAKALGLAERWTQAKADEIEKASVVIEKTRIELGTKLGLAPETLMKETGSDPSDFIAEAAKKAAAAASLLGEGSLEAAESALSELSNHSLGARRIVEASVASVESHAKSLSARLAETERLLALTPGHQETLASIAAKYAASAMLLIAGDASHPNANGTISDNMDEAADHLKSARNKAEQASKVFKEGKVLEAAGLLAQVAAHQEIASARFDEIDEKMARLVKTGASNAQALAEMDRRVEALKAEIPGDKRSMKETLKSFSNALKLVENARGAVEAAKGDPFQAEARLAAAAAALEQAWVAARNDRDAYAEAGRSLKAAMAGIDAAKQEAAKAAGDSIADSPAILQAYKNLDSLAGRYASAMGRFGQDHGDWNEVDKEADSIAAQAAQVQIILKNEEAAGQAAISAITKAAAKVKEATNWSGSYGVYISGSPGSGSLESARAALRNGDYPGAMNHAESAAKAAKSAIDKAEAEVHRLYAAEQARLAKEAAARRRREEAAAAALSRSYGNGGGSSSWGSSNSGGGSSSWGSSNSGCGRSGW